MINEVSIAFLLAVIPTTVNDKFLVRRYMFEVTCQAKIVDV
jgi:hypothetical protein